MTMADADTNWIVVNPYKDKDAAKGFVSENRESILQYYRYKRVSPFHYSRPFNVRIEYLYKTFILPLNAIAYVDLSFFNDGFSNGIQVCRFMWAKLEYFCGFNKAIKEVCFVNVPENFDLTCLTSTMLTGPKYTKQIIYSFLPEYKIENCNLFFTDDEKYIDVFKKETNGNFVSYQLVPIGKLGI